MLKLVVHSRTQPHTWAHMNLNSFSQSIAFKYCCFLPLRKMRKSPFYSQTSLKHDQKLVKCHEHLKFSEHLRYSTVKHVQSVCIQIFYLCKNVQTYSAFTCKSTPTSVRALWQSLRAEYGLHLPSWYLKDENNY